MVNIKTIWMGIFLSLFQYSSSYAQSLGIAAMVNTNTNGINLSYSKTQKNWTWDAGLRITINTQSLNDNKENYINYQTGYANSLLEHFTLNFRLSRKLFAWKMIQLDGMTNIHFSCQSLLIKLNYIDSNKVKFTEMEYFKPSPAIEATIGLLLQVNFSKKVSLFAASGIGYIYFNHSYQGWNRTTNNPVIYGHLNPNRTRGTGEFVGLDGMPMMTIGLKYKLK